MKNGENDHGRKKEDVKQGKKFWLKISFVNKTLFVIRKYYIC